ncbi:hypothetical protein FJTKL_00675 [Diaporthe vaccinii]|uniref:Uncharacterized protein n=1 Tax=Diaporthe vaccinii TaxID=105482 RepID=A0ABR4F664_9PEZI
MRRVPRYPSSSLQDTPQISDPREHFPNLVQKPSIHCIPCSLQCNDKSNSESEVCFSSTRQPIISLCIAESA